MGKKKSAMISFQTVCPKIFISTKYIHIKYNFGIIPLNPLRKVLKNNFFLASGLKISLDKYIGRRYIIAVDDISVNDISNWRVNMENIALTEAVYYIMLSLYQPLHGYGIMQKVAALSNGRLHLAAGTLYGAINALLGKGWIKALPEETNSRKKEYIITEQGKEILSQELSRLRELVSNGEQTIEGRSGK